MSEEKDLLKYAFEGTPTVFQALAGQRTHRVFKGFSKDISQPEVHGGTGRTLELKGPWFEPGATPLTWEGQDIAEVEPLTELETALIMWAACGPNGIVGGDIGVNENLSTMVCMAGRTIPGPTDVSERIARELASGGQAGDAIAAKIRRDQDVARKYGDGDERHQRVER